MVSVLMKKMYFFSNKIDDGSDFALINSDAESSDSDDGEKYSGTTFCITSCCNNVS